MKLLLAPRHLAILHRHARASYPAECCGFLVGRVRGTAKVIARVAPARNEAAESSRHRYLISPQAYFHAECDARGRGLTVLGFYHSHPEAAAEPSEEDRTRALPGLSYVVVAVRGGEPGELRSWVLAEDRMRFDPEPLGG